MVIVFGKFTYSKVELSVVDKTEILFGFHFTLHIKLLLTTIIFSTKNVFFYILTLIKRVATHLQCVPRYDIRVIHFMTQNIYIIYVNVNRCDKPNHDQFGGNLINILDYEQHINMEN